MLISLILILSIVTRAGTLLSSKSLWGDEWASLFLSGGSFFETIFRTVGDVHPPFYFLLLRGVTALFGDAEWVIRLPSIAAGVLTVYAVWRVGLELLDRRAAALAALAVSVSPFFLQASNEVRGYSLVAALSWTALWLGLRALKRGTRGAWALYAAAALLSVYTEHYAWLPVFIFFGYALHCRRRGTVPRANFLWAPWVVIAVAGLLPSAALVLHQAAGSEQIFKGGWMAEHFEPFTWVKKLLGLLIHFSEGYLFAHLTNAQLMQLLSSPVVSIVILGGTLPPILWTLGGLFDRQGAEASSRRLLGLLWLVPILAILAAYPARFSARYLIVAAPAFVLLASKGLSDRFGRPAHSALLGAYGAVVVLSLAYFYRLETDVIHREDWKAPLRFLEQNAGPEDTVVGLSQPYDYYRRHARVQVPARFVNLPEEGSGGTVWVALLGNKDEAINQRMAAELNETYGRFSLRPAGPCLRFGGPRGLVLLFQFNRKGGEEAAWPPVVWSGSFHAS